MTSILSTPYIMDFISVINVLYNRNHSQKKTLMDDPKFPYMQENIHDCMKLFDI